MYVNYGAKCWGAVTGQIVTSLGNLDTEAISALEYDFLTQTGKQKEKRTLS